MATSRRLRHTLLAALAVALACGAPADTPADRAGGTLTVEIGSEPFALELALDPDTRFRGLGGRQWIPPRGGMLFAFRSEDMRGAVMRDCPVPLDIAFLDASGRVVALHAMRPEPVRRADESTNDYEARLPVYSSGVPAQFVVETAGGRLAEVGLRLGDRIGFDVASVARRAR